MKDFTIETQYCQLALEELSDSERELVAHARKATDGSYSPYSHFRVGAAVRLADGTIVVGANQENAAYPSGLCAERVALFAASSQHPHQAIVAIAIAARNDDGEEISAPPCGACRQVLIEYEHRHAHPIQVLLYSSCGVVRIPSAQVLLPLAFTGDGM